MSADEIARFIAFLRERRLALGLHEKLGDALDDGRVRHRSADIGLDLKFLANFREGMPSNLRIALRPVYDGDGERQERECDGVSVHVAIPGYDVTIGGTDLKKAEVVAVGLDLGRLPRTTIEVRLS